MFVRPLARASTLLLTMMLLGCGGGSGNRPASFASWQGQMQSYVTNQANGDMNALRDVQVNPGQPGFRAFSNDRPEKSKDIVGVLVGARPIDDRLWYVYIVGEVDKEQVGVIRLAALSLANGQYVWRVGGDEASAAATYRAHREQTWKSQHGSAPSLPRGAMNFPGVEDQFVLTILDPIVTVRESASGATWTLNLVETHALKKGK